MYLPHQHILQNNLIYSFMFWNLQDHWQENSEHQGSNKSKFGSCRSALSLHSVVYLPSCSQINNYSSWSRVHLLQMLYAITIVTNVIADSGRDAGRLRGKAMQQKFEAGRIFIHLCFYINGYWRYHLKNVQKVETGTNFPTLLGTPLHLLQFIL